MEYVKRRVLSGDINIAELARLSGVSHWTIRNLRSGRSSQYMANTADSLARALRDHFPEADQTPCDLEH